MIRRNQKLENYENIIGFEPGVQASDNSLAADSPKKRRPSEATRLKKSLQIVQDAGLQPVSVKWSETGFEILFQTEAGTDKQDDYKHWHDKIAMELDE